MTKNCDLPAMPAIMLIEVESNSGLKYELKTECTGLTKREKFAMAAMQGLLANEPDRQPFYIAADSVIMADALLAELERT